MQQLGMFAKYWEPGRVKTRLAATIGPDAASALYREFIYCLALRLDAIGQRRVVYFTPNDRAADFRELLPSSWDLETQCDGDLGRRMQHYFDHSLCRGSDRIVLIGSDSPTLSPRIVEKAFRALEDHRVVLGPTTDGGYYLIGVRDAVPPIFEGIEWSTRAVWQQTIEALQRSGTNYAELEPWYDVDERPDLQRLRADLAADTSTSEALVRLAEKLDHLVPP